MKQSLVEKLELLAKEADDIHSFQEYARWKGRVENFLRTAVGADETEDFLRIESEDFSSGLGLQIGFIEGLAAKGAAEEERIAETVKDKPIVDMRKIFIVHGHDNEAKEMVARFVIKMGLNPIILHEQANAGRTIIEKFEVYADVPFAIVLLTPDDVGADARQPDNLQPRARQNVIIELGYFIGKLGRGAVCALHKAKVEIPSDIQGVVYITLDEEGGWQRKLAQEFIEAKLPIRIKGIFE